MEQLGQRPFFLASCSNIWAKSDSQRVRMRGAEIYSDSLTCTLQASPLWRKDRVLTHVVYKIKVEDDDSCIRNPGLTRMETKILTPKICNQPFVCVRQQELVWSQLSPWIKDGELSKLILRWLFISLDLRTGRFIFDRPRNHNHIMNCGCCWLRDMVSSMPIENGKPYLMMHSWKWDFQHFAAIFQLFVNFDTNGMVILQVMKIVDDILVCGSDVGSHQLLINSVKCSNWVL